MSKTSITTHREAKICKYTLSQFKLIGKDNKKSVKVVNIFLDDFRWSLAGVSLR